MSAVDAVAAHLASLPGLEVYPHAVPNGTLPSRYLLVRGSVGDEESSTMCDARDLRTPIIWVMSVSMDQDPPVAAAEAADGAQRVRDLLRGWRPILGRANWKVTHEVSSPPRSDDSLPTTAFVAVEQFSLLHQV